MGKRTGSVVNFGKGSGEDPIIYNFESQSIDLRKGPAPNGMQSATNNNNLGLMGSANTTASMFRTHYNMDSASSKFLNQSERSQELSRLKKEYNQMVRKEINRMHKDGRRDGGVYSEVISKSPERSGKGSAVPNSYGSKVGAYINANINQTNVTTQGSDYVNSGRKKQGTSSGEKKSLQRENSTGGSKKTASTTIPSHKRCKSQNINQPGYKYPNQKVSVIN
mmetsp:Transcript_14377/g.13965  ORF Transcript_14377/g.13965 Transcript_14377/m.13965 type:complete len:222 (-) Transcript_14377:902-1567(-)